MDSEAQVNKQDVKIVQTAMLRTNLATRRTDVRLRGTIKARVVCSEAIFPILVNNMKRIENCKIFPAGFYPF